MLTMWSAIAAIACAGACDDGLSIDDPSDEPTTERTLNLGAEPRFPTFETGQVRPLALDPSGQRLYAVNTPDSALEVYKVTSGGLKHQQTLPVGLEPVSVAVRNSNEVWVVNHLSDSVSIVRFGLDGKGRIVRTILVGDEPRDIVFAGNRAFITTAHRGQNNAADPQLTTPGIGRADVWVFDANALGSSLGGAPLTIISLFADTPRALAVSPDGTKVYAAAFHSGNRTTVVHHDAVPEVSEEEGGPPGPNENHAGEPEQNVGFIVKKVGGDWLDAVGRSWNQFIAFDLPDKDVFVIDATANPPVPIASKVYRGVGTTLFNMVVNPASGKIYVSNTDARNDQRLEGSGVFFGPTLRGHLVDSRITVLGAASVTPRYLNKHIDYSNCCAPVPNPENALSLAFPQQMVVTNNGATLYAAALGSSKIGIFNTAALENDSFVPSLNNQISVSGGGPTGLALDEQRGRLYVLTRFDNGIAIVDTQARQEIGKVLMHNPEPISVVAGRRFLYDASYTSSHGDSACASCHIFGDTDHLAWDLGNPDGDVRPVPGPIALTLPGSPTFHPLKGPMTTQSLRGMANHGAMHWRGDRTGGYFEPSVQPDEGSFDEVEAFRQFNPAFASLNGRDVPLTESEITTFGDFALQILYPPNPIRALDNSLTADQAAGRYTYFNTPRSIGFVCNDCHRLDPTANAEFGVASPGLFGTSGEYVIGEAGQSLKIPHFRNAYQKVGMFGVVSNPLFNPELDGSFQGDQIRGFGFLHSGAFDSPSRFLSVGFTEGPFNPGGFPQTDAGRAERRQVEAFLYAYDSNLAPIVGQQITLTATNSAVAVPRISLLIARAEHGECELIARSGHRSYLYDDEKFHPDKAGAPKLSKAQMWLIAKLPGQEVTFTCVPVGAGRRMGLDRDLDGVLNRDE